MAEDDDTLDGVLDSLRSHLAAEQDPGADTPPSGEAGTAAHSGEPMPAYPVVDVRVLPEPSAMESFADEIPVLSDMVVAGDPTVRDRLSDDELMPGSADRGLRLVASPDSAPENDPLEGTGPGDEARPAFDDSVDLTLNQDLVDEFVEAIEAGLNQHIAQALQDRLAVAAGQIAEELRDEMRTLVRRYVETYLPEFMTDRTVPDLQPTGDRS